MGWRPHLWVDAPTSGLKPPPMDWRHPSSKNSGTRDWCWCTIGSALLYMVQFHRRAACRSVLRTLTTEVALCRNFNHRWNIFCVSLKPKSTSSGADQGYVVGCPATVKGDANPMFVFFLNNLWDWTKFGPGDWGDEEWMPPWFAEYDVFIFIKMLQVILLNYQIFLRKLLM